MCDVVGPALLERLAPGAPPAVRIGDINDDEKRITCNAISTPEYADDNELDPVLFTVELTRYANDGSRPPSETAQKVLEEYQEERSDELAPGDELTPLEPNETIPAAHAGYLWSHERGGEPPQLELVARQDDSVFRLTYEPVPGIPTETARRWLLAAGTSIVGRFDDIGYGH
jgi:hypothetical protein